MFRMALSLYSLVSKRGVISTALSSSLVYGAKVKELWAYLYSPTRLQGVVLNKARGKLYCSSFTPLYEEPG
jgi:hypothetical protein